MTPQPVYPPPHPSPPHATPARSSPTGSDPRADQFRDHHEPAGRVGPDREAFLSAFAYPPAVGGRHFIAAGHSPRGYAGPAACPALLFDVDRAGDLTAALADTRAVPRWVLGR